MPNDEQQQQQQQQSNDPNNAGGPPATRPDYVPEKYWDPAAAQPRIQDAFKSLGELEKKLGQGKQLWEQERLAQRPSTPDGYAITGLKFENLPPDLVIHETLPTDKTKLDPTKRHFVMDPKDPMLGAWRQLAHENGMPPAMFQKGLAMFADKITERDRPLSKEEILAERQGEWAKLGEQGEARTQHVFNQLKAKVGDKHADALDAILGTSEAIEALEDLLIKAGAPKFGGTGGAASQTAVQSIQSEIDTLKADPEFQKAFGDRRHPQNRAMVEKLQKLNERLHSTAA